MLITCWSVKGGSGTTVVAASLAVVLSRRPRAATLLVDVCGDLPAALGVSSTGGPGVADWLGAGRDVPADALDRLAIDVGPGLALLPWGAPAPASAGSLSADEAGRLLAALRSRLDDAVSDVVVDVGRVDGDAAPLRSLTEAADLSLLVLRPCYLALRRAVACPVRPSGVVVVDEANRALCVADIEDALGVPVIASMPARPEIARAVDAGLLAGRLPRPVAAALRHVAVPARVPFRLPPPHRRDPQDDVA